jgi:hypothetical protein
VDPVRGALGDDHVHGLVVGLPRDLGDELTREAHPDARAVLRHGGEEPVVVADPVSEPPATQVERDPGITATSTTAGSMAGPTGSWMPR